MNGKFPAVFLCVLSLIGCADTSGDWSGECDIGELELSVTMAMVEEDGAITGSGTIAYVDPDNGSISEEVTVTGSRDGTAVDLELQPDIAGEMEISGTIDGDSIEGDCMWANIEGSALIERGG
ncbi:MAG: hypothetical protein ACI8RZ_002235 [Myxococcota bacterium]|jgi:hypothetical protein